MDKPMIPRASKTSYNAKAVLDIRFDITRGWTSDKLDTEEEQAEFVRHIEFLIGTLNVGDRLGMLGVGTKEGGRDFLPDGINTNQVVSVKVHTKKVTSKHTI